MLTPRVMVVKMSKMVYFLYFLLMADKLVTVWAKYSSDPKNLLEFIPKMVWFISFGVTVHEVLRVEISKKLLDQQKNNLHFQGLASC